jgi:Xaa-Pro aminopeptidase
MKPAFDNLHLDELMERAGLDALLITSKHSVQYLLGGYRYFFFDYMDAIGTSRYLPVFVYIRENVDASKYIGNASEDWQLANEPIWVPNTELSSWGSVDAIDSGLAHIRSILSGQITVGIEQSFLPADSYRRLSHDTELAIRDCNFVLERLRARKSKEELVLVERASDAIVDSMCATFARHGAGSSKREIVQSLREEQTNRGLTYEYCLVSMGASLNRGASDDVWKEGEVLCLDSGGNLGGYIGDLARMAVLGQPDSELEDLLAEVEVTQQAARRPIAAGTIGEAIYTAANEALLKAPNRNKTFFVAHGMGLISHEAPRLTDCGPVPYPNEDGPKPLEEGMVLSIETTILHSARGFIKLEDTVIVTDTGYRALGDQARGWNLAGGGTP